MAVERTHIAGETRYELRNGTALRCVLAFDTGPGSRGPAVWKILFPGPAGTENLYATHEFQMPDAAELTAWVTPLVGGDAAAELVTAVNADPPPAADWQRTTQG
jgi:hypothetical protein